MYDGSGGALGVVGLINLVTQDGKTLVTQADEELIYSDQAKPVYEWKCRTFGDKTAKICSSLYVADDLIKGDGFTAATFPAFVATNTDTGTPSHYVFDGTNDYVGNWPIMPDVYTVCAVMFGEGLPVWWTCNNSDIENALTVAGAFEGYLFRLAIFDEVLDSEQLAFLEYCWMSKIPREGCIGIENRLILDESCVLNHRYIDGDSDDISYGGLDGTDTDVTYSDTGARFLVSTSKITVAYDVSLQLSVISVAFSASINTQRHIINRGINYRITISSTAVTVLASGVSRTVSYLHGTLEHHYVITCVSGDKFLLYVDGIYIGEASDVSTLGTSSSDLTIGEQSVASNTATIGRLQIYNRELNAHEIKALYHRSKIG
jgi:hypothetical protein